MSHFRRSAKTPALLLYVLLVLLSARSLHAAETDERTVATTTEPEEPIPSVPSNETTQTPDGNATQTLNGTASPPFNDTSTSHPRNDTDYSDTEDRNATTAVTLAVTTTASKSSFTSPTPKAASGLPAPGPTTQTNDGSGAALLVFLIFFFLIAIGCLGFLLFRLYKKSRSYSFDLSSSPFNDQASDNTPLKTVEMETFHSKDTDDRLAIPTVVIDCADNQPASPVANGNVEEGPGDPPTTLDNGSSKSDPAPSDSSECGSQTECLPEKSTDVDTEQPPANESNATEQSPANESNPTEQQAANEGNITEQQAANENNNNFTVYTKAPGTERRESNFTEISLN